MAAVELTPELIAADRGYQLIGVAASFIILQTIIVGLRFLARRLNQSKLALDDWLMIPSLIMNLGLCAEAITEVRIGGVGRHIQVILAESPSTFIVWSKMTQIAIIPLYLVAVALPKLSILLFLLRVFVSKTERVITYVLMGLIISNCVGSFVAVFLQCQPFAFAWNKTLEGGHCFNQNAFYRYLSLPNIVTDVVLLALPVNLVYKLHVTRNQKYGLLLVFATGSFGVISSCIRFSIFFGENAFSDPTWASVPLIIWTIIEAGTYVVAACLPTLRPLFTYFLSSRNGKQTAVRDSQGDVHPLKAPFQRRSRPDSEYIELESGKERNESSATDGTS
ncbi:hypothetical protein MMC25_002521 [Agyrium rufum]|nr:hypothetical protein [Agyrium rufum]